MTESQILSGFYSRTRAQFLELTPDDMLHRSGVRPGHPVAQSLIQRHFIRRATDDIYQITTKGKARVNAMITMGELPGGKR